LKTAYREIHVVRVPAYSPYAIAEHAVAMILTLNRKIHRAYYRTKEGNFSIDGLLGFNMYGKVAGIIGTAELEKKRQKY
jgi:D-lactate dehydrogenase